MTEGREIMLTQSYDSFLQITDLGYQYHSKKSFVLEKLSFALEKGELLVILGPSGSGKSTLLQLIAGLLQPSQGSIFVKGEPIHHLPPEKRNLSMIFQKPYLLPFLTVGENVEIGLKLRRVPDKVRRNKAKKILDQVGLAGFYDRPLSSLSGGQEQRVALARSLVIHPQLLLLDEPFSQLDPLLRRQMGHWLVEIKNKWEMPMIMVTHDREEALTLGDQFLILNDGAVEQFGSLESIYFQPKNRLVAEFMGFDNILYGIKQGQHVATALGELVIHSDCATLPDGPVDVVVRSEWLQLDAASAITAVVEECFFRGEHTVVKLRINGETVTVKQLGLSTFERGLELGIRLTISKVWCLSRREV